MSKPTPTYERWQQLQDLFLEAQARDSAEREAFLAEACEGDADLRREVQELLDADAEPPALFRALSEALGYVDREAPSLEGRRIGPYELLHKLGQGGMGAVYLARRTDVGSQVALKLVRGTLPSDETVRRFLLERRLLARLEHPNIARLLDAGVTEDETPYFAMEYVEGEALTAYCDARQLGVEARLRLFVTACAAVAYAHRNLIVHRDLKPSNILVGEDAEGSAEVKLLDFGIAKLLDDDEADLQGLTRTGMQLMTPEYAAPEQIKGDPVTTATDVYALGMVLYELLTGQRPFDTRGRSTFEAARIMLATPPMKPSTAVGQATLTASGSVPPAQQRAATPDQLQRKLRGDLDVICLKALRKEPQQRYPSADALLADVQRYLDGLPVEARAQTVGYRLRTFVRRNRRATAATAFVLLLLVGIVAFYTLRLSAARDAAEEARDQAERELAKSEAVTGFLMDLFEASNPDEARGREVTARELLARGAAQADTFSADLDVQAELLDVIGIVYQNLGQYDAALPLHEQAVRVRRAADADPLDLAQSMHELAVLHFRLADSRAAEQLMRDVVRHRAAALGADHPDVAIALDNVAVLLSRQGRYDEAADLYARSLEVLRRAYGDEHDEVAISLNNLAVLYDRQGRFGEAEPLFREVVAIRQATYEPPHTGLADALTNLGLLRKSQAEFAGDAEALAEADALFGEALAMREVLFGDRHPQLALSQHHLGEVRLLQSRPDEAEMLMRSAIAQQEALLPPGHQDRAMVLHTLARIHEAQGRTDEALTVLDQALTMLREQAGAAHPNTARAQRTQGRLLQAAGRSEEAAEAFGAAVAVFADGLQAHPEFAVLCAERAALYAVWGRPMPSSACPAAP